MKTGSDSTSKKRIVDSTPSMRLISLIEVIAEKSDFFSLQELTEELNLPKPTLYRMLQQLDEAGIIQRDGDHRHYSSAQRFRNIAENVLINSTIHGSRRSILNALVDEVNESCNITCCAGSDVLYLERVETPEPLRFYLHSGSHVPLHCSASGKLFLSQMSKSQRQKLLAGRVLKKFTDNTIDTFEAFEREIGVVKKNGYAVDDEEYLPGLTCLAVLVNTGKKASNIAVAIQAPTQRFHGKLLLEKLPALKKAATALAHIESSNDSLYAKNSDA